MKKLLVFISAALFSLAAFAEDNGLLVQSVDPQADSVAIAKMRARMDSIRRYRPTVALVLSGGGAKGASHIGVLRYLEEKGVPIDLIGGTSMGGLVGGLYAAGNNSDKLAELFTEADWGVVMSDKTPIEYYSFEKRQEKDMYVLSLPFEFKGDTYKSLASSLPDGGLYGFNIYNIMNTVTVNYQDSLDFINLPIPFYCVATEVNSNKERNIYSGYLPEAIRSTIAIPMVFRPVRKDNEVLLDGGLKNNYPVDIARAMGADIIIGVDLHTPDDPNDHIINIMMNMLFGIGSASYAINKDAADIYIKPDMEGFWTMSFGKEEIAEIMKRGYDAIQAQEESIDKLMAALHNKKYESHKRHNNLDISKDKIQIASFGFDGMQEEDIEFFKDKIHFDPNLKYDSSDFEEVVTDIFSTGAFRSVRYRICGNSEPYSVIFECEKGPKHTFDLGFRMDTEQIIAAVANLGFGKNKVKGWKEDLTLRLSSCPRLDFDCGYIPAVGPKIGFTVSSCFTNVMNYQNLTAETSAFNFWRSYGQFYVEDSRWSRLKLAGGIRADYARQTRNATSNSCYSVFGDFKINSLDDSYFPTKGVRFTLGAEFVFAHVEDRIWSHVETLYSQALLDVPITFCDRFTVNFNAAASDITGPSGISPYRTNSLGGTIRGRYFDRQLPLQSLNGVMFCQEKLATGGLDFRVRIGEKNYVSVIGDVFAEGAKWNEIGQPYWGVSLQYSRPTILGALFANAHWSSYLNGFGIYAGIGKAF